MIRINKQQTSPSMIYFFFKCIICPEHKLFTRISPFTSEISSNDWMSSDRLYRHMKQCQRPHLWTEQQRSSSLGIPSFPCLGECHLQVSLFCAVLCQFVSFPYLSGSSLCRLAGLPSHLFRRMVSKRWHSRSIMSSLRRLHVLCPGPFQFSHVTVYLYDFYPLHDPTMLVLLSLYWLLNTHLCIWSVRPLVCSVLVWWVSRHLHHMS